MRRRLYVSSGMQRRDASATDMGRVMAVDLSRLRGRFVVVVFIRDNNSPWTALDTVRNSMKNVLYGKRRCELSVVIKK